VMKPALYSRRFSMLASSWAVAMVSKARSVGLPRGRGGPVVQGEYVLVWPGGSGRHHVGQRHRGQCLLDGLADQLLVAAQAAMRVDAAMLAVDAAGGEADRPFHGTDHVGNADRLGRPGEAITTVRTALRGH